VICYLMQRKPIANKYRKGTMKSTLQARTLWYRFFGNFVLNVQAPKGVKERVKSPNSFVCVVQQRGKKTLLSLTLICYCHLVGMEKIVRGSTSVRVMKHRYLAIWLTNCTWHCLYCRCFSLTFVLFAGAIICVCLILLWYNFLRKIWLKYK